MAKNDLKMPLPKLDDLFKNQEERNDEMLEKIIDIPLSKIDDFPNHPFKVLNNDAMEQLKQSIIDNGVMNPILVRPKENGRYELVSGHRRKLGSQLADKETIPCIVRDLTTEEATIIMVDSNMQQREKILPSEKAFAYKMKLEAMSHQGSRSDLTSGQIVRKLDVADLIGKDNDESGRQVRRFIRLTHLIPPLLEMVDQDKIALSPAVEISFLKESEQLILLDCIQFNIATPSHSQAIKMRNLSKEGKLTRDEIDDIMSEEKPNQIPTMKINEDRLRTVLPSNLERSDVEDYVVKSVEHYSNYQNKIKSVLPKNIKESDVDDFVVKSIRHYSTFLKKQEQMRDAR